MTMAALVTWDGLTADDIAVQCGAKRVELFSETDSTLDVAHALAEQGALSGTVVVADSQRAGRGRLGRPWSSLPGLGVWCTVVERPADTAALDVLSIRVGLELAEGLDGLGADRIDLKWPNDLLLRGGKLAGILTETRWSAGAPAWVAVGVGVNIVAPTDVPGGVGLGAGVARIDVLRAVLRAVQSAAARTGHLSAEEESRYRLRDALRGRRIVEPVAGTVDGVTASGELLVRTSRGVERVRAGTIRVGEGENS